MSMDFLEEHSKGTAEGLVPPVTVTLIGTKNDDIPAPGTVAITPKDSQPNLIVNVVTPVAAIFIRFANAYLTTLIGLVTAGMATDIIPATDFVSLVIECAKLSLAGPGLSFGKDLITVFGKLEQKYPLLTGSI